MAAAAHNPTGSKELKDQAAAAALYVTEPQRKVQDPREAANWPLDANGKLTSAGAATSLKRADAKDLPSFPSSGLAQSAAGGAALLANQNQKSFEWWKPEASAGASKAAMHAKDYKMDPLWQPESSAAGSKAAMLAHKKGHGAQFWEPTASDKALIAATGAVAGKTARPKQTELGVDRYPDERNAARNALSAATSVHGNSVRSKGMDLAGLTDEEAEKIRKQATVAGMNADLFGSKPLIGPELEDQKHQAGLHAAAVSMAQGMYGKRDKAYREKMSAAQAGSRAAAGRATEQDSDEEDTPMSFMGLQETAQKLANERLAKLQDPNEAYRKHWGTNTSPQKNRLSMFGGSVGRGSASDERMDPDEKDSRRIRGEMNLFKDKLAEIDARKRKEDRQSLLAAAQRNVKKDIAEMDEVVFQETGKMSPAMKAEWEAKARAKAKADSEQRNSNYGKVALGGGKYLDQTEIDAIAQSRLQPTLDAITAKAEHDREVDEQAREEEEERKRLERMNKEAEKEKNKMIKADWKHFKAEEKADRREREAIEKEERRKSKQAAKDAKMQEEYEERVRKEEEAALRQEKKEIEREADEAEKEHDKQINAEWKKFKKQEKEETETKKENRLSSLFRRKSKKEKEPKDDKKRDSVHRGGATTTTVITGGAAAASATAAHERESAEEPEPEPEQHLSPHHEEPHHNPLMPVEETPEAQAANKQKPGGDLIQIFKRKKAEHDEKKRQSHDAAATHSTTDEPTAVEKEESTAKPAQEHASVAPVAAGAATGAAVGAVAAHEAHDEPQKEEVDDEQHTVLEDGRRSQQPYSMHSLVSNSPRQSTVAPVAVEEQTVPDVPPKAEDHPARVAAMEPPISPASESFKSTRSAEAAAPSKVEKEDNEESATVASPVTASESPVTSTKTEEPVSPTSVSSFIAMGSDSPVTSEVRRSIIDKIEPRVNAGKPGFEGSTKFAAATADMRGTDHAGADHPSARNSSIDASAAPAAESVMQQNASAQSAEAAPPATEEPKRSGAEATAAGHQHHSSVDERISIPPNATAAAEEAVDEKAGQDTPRQKEAKEKSSHRISGFFRSKFGAAGKKLTKEHKASDGVVVSPTTQATTHGKYVDPNDNFSTKVDALVPANKDILDHEASDVAVDPAYKVEASSSAAGGDEAIKSVARGRTDMSDEARDTVDTDLPPPKIPSATRASESPARETRFREEI